MGATTTSLTPQDNRELLGAAAAAFGASRDDNERALYEATRQMVLAFAWGRFGDPYRCTDGLLEAGGLLLERDAAPRDGGWEASYVDELAEVLERIRDGYREQDVAQLLAAARERQ